VVAQRSRRTIPDASELSVLCGSFLQLTNQPINQSTNQPINQSTNQPINRLGMQAAQEQR
jgi:hypothetical protein